jgi:hypothetical protein
LSALVAPFMSGLTYRVVHVVANAGRVGLPSWWREYVNSLLD